MIELKAQSATATPDTSIEDFETWCNLVSESQRGVLWWLGDLALMAERRWPDKWNQVFPVWISPDQIARCKAVSAAYKPEDRNLDATWSIHMTNSKRPDRVSVVAAHVEAGHTSDEARKNPQPSTATKTDWLLAVDVNGFVCSYFFGTPGEQRAMSAENFVSWLVKLIERTRAKGLTDVVCCMDSRTNFRKALTETWEKPYKSSRTAKEEELTRQLRMVPDLLKAQNMPVVSIDDMEADDVIASYAVQFSGNVTIASKDKDMRQCLKTGKCNILSESKEELNEETGSYVYREKWITETSHINDGMSFGSVVVKDITPEQWPHYQAIAGDSVDDIDGVKGIGAKGAMDLIKAHGTVSGVIAAAESGLIALTEKKRQAVLEFASVADVMLKLVTLKTDLQVPMITKLCGVDSYAVKP